MDISVDFTQFNVKESNSSQPESVPIVVKDNFNPHSLYYDMGKNKYFHIFNHYQYDETDDFEIQPEVRDGTEADVRRLHEVFEPLGFIVKLHNDFTYVEIMNTIKEVVERNHTETSCVGIAILTHGDKEGELYARDKPYNLKDVTQLLEDKNLVAIPKLLFIQACRGDIAEAGYYVAFDSTSKVVHVPSQIDFMIMNSTVEVVERNHTETSCVGIAILTHGDKEGGLYARDRPYNWKDVTLTLEDKNLVAIPKILFIQACRGDIAEADYYVAFDSTSKVVHVPSQIDFLIMNSTVEGYCSFRGEVSGSWMIQVLCSVIEEYHREYDILTMITFINHYVGYRLTSSNEKKPEIHNKKQTIETRFTLTKLLKF